MGEFGKEAVDCVNGIFSGVMDRAHGGIDYDENAALKKGVAYEGPLDREVTLHLVDSTEADDFTEGGIVIDEEIAELKMPDLNAATVEAAMSMVAGTCRSMGVVVEE